MANKRSIGRAAMAFALYGLGAVIFTWPLALHITTDLPLGSESSPTVPLFNLWTLGWNTDRLLHGYRAYWQAPIFFPVHGAFAFSDPQPLTGLLAVPWWNFSPALAYNWVLLLYLTLNGWSLFSLLKRRGVPLVPSLVGGLLGQSLPYLTHERGVLQLQPYFGMLWALEGYWEMLTTPNGLAATVLGAGILVTFLTSEYYGLVLLILLTLMGLWGLRHWRTPREWMAPVGVATLATALTLPILLGQRAILQDMGFNRSQATIQAGSAKLSYYLRPPDEVWEDDLFPRADRAGQYLFPGAGLLLLSVLGSVESLRNEPQRSRTSYLILSAGVAFFISLGLNPQIRGWHPNSLLWDYVPGFEHLRSPFRFSLWVQISLVLLAGPALAALWQGRQRWLFFALAVLSLLEIFPNKARLTTVSAPLSTGIRGSSAVFIPLPTGTSSEAYSQTATWMAQTLPSGISLVNGYSGYFTRLHSQLKDLLADFPTPAGLRALRAMGVQTIYVQADWPSAEQFERLNTYEAGGELALIEEGDGLQVYRILGTRFNPARLYAGPWAVKTSLGAKQLSIRAYATVPDSQVYVMAPEIAPLHWKIKIENSSGEEQAYFVSPAGALLLYHGSDRWLTVPLPRPKDADQYRVTLWNADTGQKIATTDAIVP